MYVQFRFEKFQVNAGKTVKKN